MRASRVMAVIAGVASALFPGTARAVDPAAHVCVPDRLLVLTVVDPATNGPLPGATVKAKAERRDDQVLTTDDAGNATITFPADAGFLMVTAIADRRVPTAITWRPPGHGWGPPTVPDAFALPLPAGTHIGGVVRDEAGQPVTGATVYLLVPGNDPDDAVRVAIWDLPVTTDADGRWACDVMPADLRDIWIRTAHPDFISDPVYQSQGIPPIAQLRDGTGVLTMRKGIAVTGRVVRYDGQPVAGAVVRQGADRFGSHHPEATTDADGRFTFAHCRPGELVLTVQHDQFAPDLRTLTVAEGTPPVEFTLQKGNLIRGEVVDSGGQPLEDVFVGADAWRGHRSLRLEARTAKNGRFQFVNAPGDPVLFDIVKQGYADLRQHALGPSPELQRVTLRPPLRVTGTVTDAGTGEPIRDFRVREGIHWGGDRPVYWDPNSRPTVGRDGRFEVTFTYPRAGHAVRVEADGYLPAASRVFTAGEGAVALDLELTRGADVAGVVRAPDGTPAAGVDVALVLAGSTLQVINGAIPGRDRRDHLTVTTGLDGRYSFPPQTGSFLLVAVGPAGYAEMPADAWRPDAPITLQAWARVEGTMMIGSRPATGEQAAAWYPRDHKQDAPNLYLSNTADVDDNGRFIVDRVAPGEVVVSRAVRVSENGTGYSHQERLTVAAGQTATVTIGGTGRPVVGRIVVPEQVAAVSGWTWAPAGLSTKVTFPKLEVPADVKAMDPADRTAWHDAWLKTPEGQAHSEQTKAAQRAQRHFSVRVERDGSFRVDDVPAGAYQFSVTANRPPAQGTCGWGDAIGSVEHEFTVPDMPTGRSDEPLDLPPIDVTVLTSVGVGDAAPALTATTVDGKPLSLADFAGRYVLLDFWAVWCGPCVAETPNLKATYDAFGADPRFAMVGLSLDDDPAAPRAYAERNGLGWTQGFLGEWAKSPAPGAWGVRGIPSIFLVGPDGKVIAKDLRGPAIRDAVQRALATAAPSRS